LLIGKAQGPQAYPQKKETGRDAEPTLENALALRDLYAQKYERNFIKFCKNLNIYPSIDKFYGLCRLGTPVGYYPANDTQFYMHFCDYEPIDETLHLNQDEFTSYKWLAVDEALDLYARGELPVFLPQLAMLTALLFLNKNYMELR